MGICDKFFDKWINQAFGSYCPTCKAPNSLKYSWKAGWKHMFSCKYWVVCTSCGAEFSCGFKRGQKLGKRRSKRISNTRSKLQKESSKLQKESSETGSKRSIGSINQGGRSTKGNIN